MKYIGYFDGEEEAGRAYDCAMLALKGVNSGIQTNFPPALYTAEEIAESKENVWGIKPTRVLLLALYRNLQSLEQISRHANIF